MSASLYFDNAATMQPDEKMIQEYGSLCREYWWNPSSASQCSMETRQYIENARKSILGHINGQENDKIIFTSGGTEANNLAIKGFCCEKYTHLLTTGKEFDYRRITPSLFISSLEHPSVTNPTVWLYEMGIANSVNMVRCYDDGTLDLESLEERIRYTQDTKFHPIFASIMMANNELGSVNDIKAVSGIVHKYDGILHVDAVQAFTHMKIDVQEMGIDMMSVSGHKFGAPHGVGFLYVKDGIEISPLLHGGGQEKGLRSGTEDAPSIIMMGDVINRVYENFDKDSERLVKCRNLLWDLLSRNFDVRFNSPWDGLCNIINVTLDGIDNEQLITNLDTFEFCQVSAGSACHAGVKKPSKVLKEIGLTDKEINNTIRISMDRNTTEYEIKLFVAALKEQVKKLQML